MAVTPTKEASKSTETTEAKFRRLEALWRAQTAHLSSTTKIIDDPSFQEIIGMGDAVIPFMLRDLAEKPRLWVWALAKITGTQPASEGNIEAMTKAWLRWGKEHGYQW